MIRRDGEIPNVRDHAAVEILRSFGYDPDDPVRGLDPPDRLLRLLAHTRVVESDRREPSEDDHLTKTPLSDRQRDILWEVAHGYRNKEIAQRLLIGEETIKTRRLVPARLSPTAHAGGRREVVLHG